MSRIPEGNGWIVNLTLDLVAELLHDNGPVELQQDGDQWMARWGDFENIQESPCSFAPTEKEAIKDFLASQIVNL